MTVGASGNFVAPKISDPVCGEIVELRDLYFSVQNKRRNTPEKEFSITSYELKPS